MLIEHMQEGLSFESFAGIVKVNSTTLYDWIERHKSFANAKTRGQQLSLLWWEKALRAGSMGKIPGFNSAAAIFNMKNRFGWKSNLELTGKDGAPVIEARNTHSELVSAIKQAMNGEPTDGFE